MKYQLYFSISEHGVGEDDYTPIHEDYSFWVSVMRYFMEKSDSVEIHCWNGEEEVIEETKFFFKGEPERPDNMTVFQGALTEELAAHLLTAPVTRSGNIKWFSIFLSKGDQTLFHSEHHGSEFFAPNLSKKEIAYIKSVMPAAITNYHQYV